MVASTEALRASLATKDNTLAALQAELAEASTALASSHRQMAALQDELLAKSNAMGDAQALVLVAEAALQDARTQHGTLKCMPHGSPSLCSYRATPRGATTLRTPRRCASAVEGRS
jgi:uncharacterized coiled-coil protein SlyX